MEGLTGALLQAARSGPALLAILGALLVATGAASMTASFGGWRPSPKAALGLGLMSGLFGGLAGNQGGLRAAGVLAFDLTPRALLATSTAVALLVDLARTPVYLLRAGRSSGRSRFPPRSPASGACWDRVGRAPARAHRRGNLSPPGGRRRGRGGSVEGLPRSGLRHYRSPITAPPPVSTSNPKGSDE